MLLDLEELNQILKLLFPKVEGYKVFKYTGCDSCEVRKEIIGIAGIFSQTVAVVDLYFNKIVIQDFSDDSYTKLSGIFDITKCSKRECEEYAKKISEYGECLGNVYNIKGLKEDHDK